MKNADLATVDAVRSVTSTLQAGPIRARGWLSCRLRELSNERLGYSSITMNLTSVL
jgi:hypothetical protein